MKHQRIPISTKSRQFLQDFRNCFTFPLGFMLIHFVDTYNLLAKNDQIWTEKKINSIKNCCNCLTLCGFTVIMKFFSKDFASTVCERT